MPRQARLDIPGLIHHVMARGIEGRDIFRDDEDRVGFLKRLTGAVDRPGGSYLYAWAIMPNHFHLLLRPGESGLSSVMRRLMTGHAVTYNKRHQRQGHLFQNRYKSFVVEEEPYFLELIRYIHLNPIRAGIVPNLEELASYPYAGHSVILGRREFVPQDVDSVLARFSSRRRAALAGYRDFAAALSQNPEDRQASDERILGSGDFVESVLRENDISIDKPTTQIDDVLKEVAAQSGISCEQILGPSRSRIVCQARRQFFQRAHEESGATISMLGKLTGRSHVAVKLAIDIAKSE